MMVLTIASSVEASVNPHIPYAGTTYKRVQAVLHGRIIRLDPLLGKENPARGYSERRYIAIRYAYFSAAHLKDTKSSVDRERVQLCV